MKTDKSCQKLMVKYRRSTLHCNMSFNCDQIQYCDYHTKYPAYVFNHKKPKISKIIDERIHVHTNLPHKPPTKSLSTLQLMKVRSLSMLQTVIKIVKGKYQGQEQMMDWLFIKI